ncbi:MAG: PIG-L family deacetylase [Candidatus Dadabacteria bacterium]
MKIFAYLLCSLIFAQSLPAQAPVEYTSADIYQGLRKLNVLGTVLYVAAHPDDENTRLITFLSKDKLYRTGYLSLTRGDGGQNLIGEEQGVELGLIRTQELLSARRIDGGEQFFSRAYDFGFSKTPDETLKKWDREKILSDVVWVIRKFRPDVIITRFPTTGEGGHGHHTASAILANEAFTAAADPTSFPEQLKYVQPWQAKRILWNTFNFGGNNTTNTEQFHFDVGGYNPILGKSYGELAAESRSQHKSQGFGVSRSRGEAFEYFTTTGGTVPVNDLFDQVNTSWSRLKDGSKIQQIVSNLISTYDFSAPQKSVPQLVNLYKLLSTSTNDYWKNQKMKEVKDLIEQAGGLWMEAFTQEPYGAEGDSVRINFSINDRLGIGAKLNEISIDGYDSLLDMALVKNRNQNLSRYIYIKPDKPVTQPYWLKEKMSEGRFEVNDQRLIGQPDVEPAYIVSYTFNINGENITFTKPVKYKFSDQVKGEIYQPFFVVPPATVNTSPDILLLQQKNTIPVEVAVQVNASKLVTGTADVNLKSLQLNETKRDSAFNINKNSNKLYSFLIHPEKVQKLTTDYIYGSVHQKTGGKNLTYNIAMRSINYDHIPAIRYFYEDPIKSLYVDLKTAGKRIGYIEGAGDKVPAALEQMGYQVTLLTEKEIAKNNLQQFDAIITGVRAFNTNEWMNKYYDKLMKYVENGGNYIVQYSQNNNIKGKMGPYQFTVSSRRVTDENAIVTFVKPKHQLLNYPNKINQDDFNGWIQERSIYHAANLDPHYQTIFSLSDPGEQPDEGSLITTEYGKGHFTYTGLVFFRELPAGIPGAYRLMANIIALNEGKEF